VFVVNVPNQNIYTNGIMTIACTSFSATNSAVRIDGSNNGIAQQTTATGTMLQIVGFDGPYATRVLIDDYNEGNTSSYPLLAGRASRGNSANPTSIQAGDILFRIGGQGYGNTFTLLGGASIDYVASENYTDLTKGSQLNFTTTPVGTNARSTSLSVNSAAVVVNTNAQLIANNIVANVITANAISVAANVSTGNVSGTTGTFTNVLGTLQTASQPNITTVGTLGSLTVSGNTTTGNISVTNAITANSIVLSDSGLYQYTTSNNTTVTQLTSKSTAVYSNGRTGQITTNNSALNNNLGTATFTVYNSQVVGATDIIILNQASGPTTYQTCVSNVAAGKFSVTMTNVTGGGGTASDVLVLNYAIIRVN
jgi:hypothetical protein